MHFGADKSVLVGRKHIGKVHVGRIKRVIFKLPSKTNSEEKKL